MKKLVSALLALTLVINLGANLAGKRLRRN